MLQNTFLVAEKNHGDFQLPGTTTTSSDPHMPAELLGSQRSMMKPAQPPRGPGEDDSWTMLSSMLESYTRQAGHAPALDLTPCGPITELRPGDKVIVLCGAGAGITAREVSLQPDDRVEVRA